MLKRAKRMNPHYELVLLRFLGGAYRFTGQTEKAIEAFKEMAKSMTKMLESVKGPFANLASNPMQMINQIEGFPVHTRHFEKGELDRETFLKSSTQESLDESLFAAPSGYKEEDLFKR